MWPIPAAELVRICGGSCAAEGLAELAIHAATVGDLPPASGQVFVPVQEDVDGHDYVARALEAGVTLALVERAWGGRRGLAPELAARCVVVDDVLTAYRALAAHMRRGFTFPVIAVAGSNGKTTSKELIAALLGAAGLSVSKTPQTMNGFTGIPYTLCLPAHCEADPPDVLVVEIGIDALGAMADHAGLVRPDVALITALGAEHLDGLGSIEEAARQELVIFRSARRRVVHTADPRIRSALPQMQLHAGDVVVCEEGVPVAASGDAGVLRYRTLDTTPHATKVVLGWRGPEGEALRGTLTIPLGGEHNACNLAGAVGAGIAVGAVEVGAILHTRRVAVSIPSMRCEVMQLPCGMTLVNDAYNASPASVRAALSLMAHRGWRRRPKCLVLGDMLELGEASTQLHRTLAEALAPFDATLVLVGDAMRPVAEVVAGARWFPRDAAATAVAEAVTRRRDAVVLVKGSRGMGLERVVQALMSRPAAERIPLQVAVVGLHRERVARSIALALGRADTGEIVAMDNAALAASPAPRRAAVFTGFDIEPNLAPPEGVPREEFQLALMAQPFLHLGPGGQAVLAADDEATPILAEAVPEHATQVTLPMSDAELTALFDGT